MCFSIYQRLAFCKLIKYWKLKPRLRCSFRGGAKLRAIGKTHSPLHVLLWQSKETQRALSAAAAAQVTLYSDVASWAASENRALRDVCSHASELNELAAAAQVQLAFAYKSFRKDMGMVLEGEKRHDAAQKLFQEAEKKRVKLKKQVRIRVVCVSSRTSRYSYKYTWVTLC
jgi:hypothetical protein